MDYAPGGSLRQLHPKGTQLPLDTVITYVIHVAEALQYAHQEKLIHRDIKPENMLLGRNNEILLSDFGIAIMVQTSCPGQPQDAAGSIAYNVRFHNLPAPLTPLIGREQEVQAVCTLGSRHRCRPRRSFYSKLGLTSHSAATRYAIEHHLA